MRQFLGTLPSVEVQTLDQGFAPEFYWGTKLQGTWNFFALALKLKSLALQPEALALALVPRHWP